MPDAQPSRAIQTKPLETSPLLQTQRGSQKLRQLLVQIIPDIVAFALMLVVFGWCFYLHWELWEDQAAQVYMAWGMFHGLRPYVALVDPNWPGILVPHAIAYLMAGTHAWGIRLLDLVFLYALLVATSSVLAAWGTPRYIRILCGVAYSSTYFATSWSWTAERESFCLPLFVISAIPFLLTLGPGSAGDRPWQFGRLTWFVAGCFAAASLWIKPSPFLDVGIIAGMSVFLCDRDDRSNVIRGTFFYFAAIIIVSIMVVLVLAGFGELGGFFKWGILYDLGPYAQVKFPWPERIRSGLETMTTPTLRPFSLIFCVLGTLVVLFSPRRNCVWRNYGRTLIASISLLAAGWLIAMLQGKPDSLYHFMPMNWSMSFLAAVLWSISALPRFINELAQLLSVAIIVVTAYIEPSTAGPTHGTLEGINLAKMLGPDDEIVEWGYAPTLLVSLQRPTPFMTFIGSAFMVTSPPDSWAAHEVLDRLNTALHDPKVKYLMVQRVPNYRIQKNILMFPADFLTHDPKLNKTITDDYVVRSLDELSGFDMLEHIRRPATQPIR